MLPGLMGVLTSPNKSERVRTPFDMSARVVPIDEADAVVPVDPGAEGDGAGVNSNVSEEGDHSAPTEGAPRMRRNNLPRILIDESNEANGYASAQACRPSGSLAVWQSGDLRARVSGIE